MGMALLPSAVEMLPTHLLWGPSSPGITVPPTKVALLPLPSFCSTDGHAGAANQIPSPVGVGWTQAGALRVTSLPHHQAKACKIQSALGYGEESPCLAWSMRAQGEQRLKAGPRQLSARPWDVPRPLSSPTFCPCTVPYTGRLTACDWKDRCSDALTHTWILRASWVTAN